MPRTMKDVLQFVADGDTNAMIGQKLGVKRWSIEKDLHQIYEALGCKSPTPNTRRAEAVAIGFRLGILE